MDRKPHVLLTGGQGRVAQALRQALAADGWRLTVCSRTPGNGMVSLDDMLSSTGPLAVDAVVHCAWSTVPAVAQSHPENAAEHDLPLLERLLARVKADPQPPLFVFMSTGAVYGMAPGRPSVESDIPHPMGEYAKGKLAAEQLIAASGLPHSILRVSNLYGMPSKKDDPQGVIARLVRRAMEAEVFEQWGEHSIKDYLHIADFASALAYVVEQRLTGILNIASGEPTALNDLIALVEQAVGTTLKIVHKPAAPWDVTDNRLDIHLLQSLTPWHPKLRIADGIPAEVEHVRAMIGKA